MRVLLDLSSVGGAAAIIRLLRALLKRLGRRFGVRCECIEVVKP